MNAQQSTPSVLYGTALVTSGAVGAGMFSLPIVAAGMWFAWAAVVLMVVWFFNYAATLLLLEANLRYQPGASFDTIVRSELGDTWAALNNLCVLFVMYILLYAYFSAGGSIVDNSLRVLLDIDNPVPQNVSALLFGLCLALVVWLGTALVSRLCAVFLVVMFVSFVMANGGLVIHLEAAQLFQMNAEHSYTPYIWVAIPYFVASFACSGMIPSLVKFYDANTFSIVKCLRYGTLVALVIYLVWLMACFGTLSRSEMAVVIAAGGNSGDLIAALQEKRGSFELVIGVFSNFAIITSFLSIGLGLFDFIFDRFKLAASWAGRSQAALLTFIPPAVLSFFYPKGFVLAIGYAGLVVLFSFFIVPVAMAFRNRALAKPDAFQAFGGKAVLFGVLLFSLAAAAFKLLASVDLLPSYP